MDFSIIISVPMLFALMYILTTLLHEFVLDWSRSKLFALRGDLFDYACDTNRQLYSTDAYKEMEASINKVIYSLNIMKPSMYVAAFMANRHTIQSQIKRHQKKENRRFNRQVQQLASNADRKFFKDIRRRLQNIQLVYVFASSWAMIGILLAATLSVVGKNLVAVCTSVIKGAAVSSDGLFRSLIKKDMVSKARSIEATAVGYEDLDRMYQRATSLS